MVQMCYIFISVYFRYDKIKNMLKPLTMLQQKMNTENLYNICKINKKLMMTYMFMFDFSMTLNLYF